MDRKSLLQSRSYVAGIILILLIALAAWAAGGIGLEGAIPDGYAGSVLDDMKADFKSENYSEAIVVAYAKLTQKAYEEYGAEVPENVKEEADASFWSILLGAAIFFGLMALIVYAVWDTLKGILHIL